MDQRSTNGCKVTINEKNFIEKALLSELRTDGRSLFDYRQLSISFGSEDGKSEVKLGQTHVMAYVTSQLVKPYQDRPNEGTLSVFAELSPIADPSFEPGRPGEFAVELGRIIDRGLRESMAVDTESLCVLAGRLVWAIRVDLHILDNGGNLVDAANVAALAALLTFRRPECKLGGEDAEEVTIYPPEVEEPIPLIVHHLPVAVTFAFFSNGDIMVVDPTHSEEAIMVGRITVTINASGDVCAVQKAGGEGIEQRVILQCLHVASSKVLDIVKEIKTAVETYNTERALGKVKCLSSFDFIEVDAQLPYMKVNESKESFGFKEFKELLDHDENILKEEYVRHSCKTGKVAIGKLCCQQAAAANIKNTKTWIGGPSNWDPFSERISPELLGSMRASPASLSPSNEEKAATSHRKRNKYKVDKNVVEHNTSIFAPIEVYNAEQEEGKKKSLLDAVKPKYKKRN